MKHLAMSILELYYELSFIGEDYVDPEWSTRRCADMRMAIENDFSTEEQTAFQEAALEKLNELLREPDQHGYSPRSLVSTEQKQFLVSLSEGRFDGAPS